MSHASAVTHSSVPCALQCVAVCCGVLQCVAHNESQVNESCECSNPFICTVCVAVCCSALQCAAVGCSALQCVAVRCSVSQCVAHEQSHVNESCECSNPSICAMLS